MGGLSCGKGMTSDQNRGVRGWIASWAVTRRRSAQARRRPVVLFGALLAPAILAGGLLAGEVQGLEAEDALVPGSWDGAPAVGGARAVVWAPRLVPAPDVPERRYEGVVRVRAREAVAVPVVREEARVPERVVRKPREEAVPAAPESTVGGCAGEWVDTWLWDLCRDWESERRRAEEKEAGGGSGEAPSERERDSWVPVIGIGSGSVGVG